jgi:hypoxanthine-guanine phosphoribosyltransferase
MMFGAIASHKLNVPMIALHYSSKHGNGDDKNHQNILPELDQYKTLFLVDDIIDSGATLTEIVKFYTERGNKVITGSYHFKDGASFHPDLYFWRIPSDSEFIVYPYENC